MRPWVPWPADRPQRGYRLADIHSWESNLIRYRLCRWKPTVLLPFTRGTFGSYGSRSALLFAAGLPFRKRGGRGGNQLLLSGGHGTQSALLSPHSGSVREGAYLHLTDQEPECRGGRACAQRRAAGRCGSPGFRWPLWPQCSGPGPRLLPGRGRLLSLGWSGGVVCSLLLLCPARLSTFPPLSLSAA